MAPPQKRTEAERQAGLGTGADAKSAAASFGGRGFSDPTIAALVAHGIDAPERLLFASYADLKRIPGVGKASFEEIMRYRTRFIPEW